MGGACNQAAAIRHEALANSSAVSFRSSDGVLLAGRLFGPEAATSGVVLAHMLPADQSSWFDFAARLGEQGYRALTFDFRGYCPGGNAGCAGGSKDISSTWKDVAGAVDYLRAGGIKHVALVGASMGGTASLVVASSEGDRIEAVVTLSAPESIEGLVAGPDVVQQVTAAKLFLAGNADDASAQAATHFYDESLQPKRVEILTTADHGTDILNGNQGEISAKLIDDWLVRYLPGSTR